MLFKLLHAICIVDPLLKVLSINRSSHSVSISWNLTSRFQSNGIYLTITEKPNNYMFVTPRISADKSSQCISNLKSNTGYSITVLATFNCDNVTDPEDFTTLSATSSDGSPSTQGCIELQARNGNDLPSIKFACKSRSL